MCTENERQALIIKGRCLEVLSDLANREVTEKELDEAIEQIKNKIKAKDNAD